jgi:hypothetical protein
MRFCAKTYAEGKRIHFSRITPMLLRFRDAFVANGGQGRQAAIDAGYANASAGVTSARWLKNPRILDLIAQKIRLHPGEYGPALAAKRLLRPGRPEWLRVRFKLALERHTGVKVIGTVERPALITHPSDEGLRDHLARHSADFGLDGAIQGATSDNAPSLPPKKTGKLRSVNAVTTPKKEF